MYKRLYPPKKYPAGHPDLAANHDKFGDLLQRQGEYDGARKHYERALSMRRSLYPEAEYPRGHPDLAKSLNSLGSLLQAQGEYVGARKSYEETLSLTRRLYTVTSLVPFLPGIASAATVHKSRRGASGSTL